MIFYDNTCTDARHRIPWHVCVAFANSSLLYFKFRFSHRPHRLQYTHTNILLINAWYKLVSPLTSSRQCFTRPAHPILANPHCRLVPFRPLSFYLSIPIDLFILCELICSSHMDWIVVFFGPGTTSVKHTSRRRVSTP